MKFNSSLRLIFSLSLVALSYIYPAQAPFDVLVFSHTNGFRHSSIEAGMDALRNLSIEYNFNISFTEDSTYFTAENLDSFEVVVFLNTTGDILGAAGQLAFEEFIESGGGFVGIHSATDTEYDWPWYGELIGRYFAGHPAVQSASLAVTDHNHPSTSNIPSAWNREDEWYNFQTPFPDNLNVLITVDESSYSGGTMGDFHPVSWYHEVQNGRSFYTAMGHTDAGYSEASFLDHLAGGIIWASRSATTTLNELSDPSDILVYPNPAGDIIKIKDPALFMNRIISLKLISSQGLIVHEKKDVKGHYRIEVSSLKAGIYILEIKCRNKIYRSTVLVR